MKPVHILAALALLASDAAAQCADWTPGYQLPGIDGQVYASAVFDDGSGNGAELYLAGEFQVAGEVSARNVARWDGTRFAAVGAGRPARVTSLLVWDDGNGPALWAGCATNENVPPSGTLAALARWDGTTWTGAPGGVAITGGVGALASYDEGSGPRLFVAARFTSLPGMPAAPQVVARFDGSTWSTVGAGIYSDFNSPATMVVHDDGSGPKLFAGGYNIREFYNAPAGPVWRWDGVAWNRVSSGWFIGATCRALAVVHDAGGAEILHGGGYETNTNLDHQLMRWNGATWQGTGQVLADEILTLLEVPQPGGPGRLYAGGREFTFLGVTAGTVAVFDGAQWTGAQVPLQRTTHTLREYDGGGGAKLFAGLGFPGYSPGHLELRGVARLDGASWTVPGPAGVGNLEAPLAVLAFDDGAGSALFAPLPAVAPFPYQSRIARFDGQAWTNMPGSFTGSVSLLTVYDDGVHGARMHAAGQFSTVGGQPAACIARFDGTGWTPLGAGLDFANPNWQPRAYDTAVWDDGSGPKLVVVGDFDMAGGANANFMALWDGANWSPLGIGADNQVLACAAFDDGSGPALAIAGIFHYVGGVPANGLARWDGATWSAMTAGGPANVRHFAVHDDGSGPRLFAAGANGVFRWSGSTWQPISAANGMFASFASHDDGSGSGPELYFSSTFTAIDGTPAASIARWDGSAWHAVGAGLDVYANAMTTWDDGRGPALFLVGGFTRSGDHAASRIARFGSTNAPGCTPFTGRVTCTGDGSGAPCPCGADGQLRHGCPNSANVLGAALVAEGQAHVAFDTVTLRASGLTPSGTLLFFQGTGLVADGHGAPFGDGVRCVNGTIVRLAIRGASGGSAAFGHAVAGDPSVSDAGLLPDGWGSRHYQVWFRDAQTFCTGAAYNLTNAVTIRWAP